MTTTPKKKSVTISRKPAAAEPLTNAGMNPPVAAAASDEEKAKNLIGKAVYGSIYYASYGIVFGTLLVTSFIPVPGRSLLSKAINDGSAAARKAFANAGTESPAPKTAKKAATAAA